MEAAPRTTLSAVITQCKAPLVRARVQWPFLNRLIRPFCFGLVGVSGIIVNTVVLWLLARGAHVPVLLASAVATEAAIISNFLLNDRWTFRRNKRGRLWQRFVRFNGVSLGGMGITVGLLALLTHYTPLHLLLANLIAIGFATIWNYFVNSRWTWRRR